MTKDKRREIVNHAIQWFDNGTVTDAFESDDNKNIRILVAVAKSWLCNRCNGTGVEMLGIGDTVVECRKCREVWQSIDRKPLNIKDPAFTYFGRILSDEEIKILATGRELAK